MPRPLHYGRPGSQVIPTTWQQQVAPVVTNTLGSVVTISPATGGAPAWNEATGQTETPPPTAVYGPAIAPHAGIASLVVVSDTERELDVADELATSRLYEVTLPWDAPVEVGTVGYVVTVVTDPDPGLVGRRLNVAAAEYDSRRFSRILRATLIN